MTGVEGVAGVKGWIHCKYSHVINYVSAHNPVNLPNQRIYLIRLSNKAFFQSCDFDRLQVSAMKCLEICLWSHWLVERPQEQISSKKIFVSCRVDSQCNQPFSQISVISPFFLFLFLRFLFFCYFLIKYLNCKWLSYCVHTHRQYIYLRAVYLFNAHFFGAA